MRTLQVTIPDEIFGVLSSFSKPQDEFVLEAIKEKLVREKSQNFNVLLAEGYLATAKEDLVIAKEFAFSDLDINL
jgi:hypothetical protein